MVSFLLLDCYSEECINYRENLVICSLVSGSFGDIPTSGAFPLLKNKGLFTGRPHLLASISELSPTPKGSKVV